jgi:MYXO-CTERM domain-containing protein
MKTILLRLSLAISLLAAPIVGSAQHSLNVVGYVNRPFSIGANLFGNPLNASPNNYLSTLFQPGVVPDGAVVSLWNPATLSFDTTSTFSAGFWSLDFVLNPGTGARLTTPSTFTNTFVGEVQMRDGGPFSEPIALPPLYAGPDGILLRSDIVPTASSGSDIFLNILGRGPNVGEQVIKLNSVSTYLGEDTWDVTPTLAVGEAVFLNVGPVPEPSAAALGLLGLVLLRAFRRKA